MNHDIFSFFNPKGQNSITGNLGTLEFAGSGSTAGLYCNCSNPSPIYYGNSSRASESPIPWIRKPFSAPATPFNDARGNWNSGSQSGSPSTLGFTPTAAAPAGISSAPAFYWDNTACAQNANDSVNCGLDRFDRRPRQQPPSRRSQPCGVWHGRNQCTYQHDCLRHDLLGSARRRPHSGIHQLDTFGIQRQLLRQMSLSVSYVGSQGHFISVSQPWYNRDNKLPESMAAMAGYNVSGSTATPCTGTGCTLPLLTQKATATNLSLAQSLGFAVPNPYNPADATYYSGNSVYQYYVGFPQFSGLSDTTAFVGNSNWNALEISLVQRHSYGLDLMLNYTYSKSIDDLGHLPRKRQPASRPFDLHHGPAAEPGWQPWCISRPSVITGSAETTSGSAPLPADGLSPASSPITPAIRWHLPATGCGGSSILGTCMPSIVPGQPRTHPGNIRKSSRLHHRDDVQHARHMHHIGRHYNLLERRTVSESSGITVPRTLRRTLLPPWRRSPASAKAPRCTFPATLPASAH